jgi:hypothetical protein
MSQTLGRVAEILTPESGGKNRSIRVSIASTVLIVHLEGVWEPNGVYTGPFVFITSQRNVPGFRPHLSQRLSGLLHRHLHKGFAQPKIHIR